MAPWSIMAIEVACVFLMLLHTVVPEAIMCSKCDSRTSKDCEDNPPVPTRCSATSDSEQFCITARELTINKTLIAFIRDCSTTKMGDECKVIADASSNAPHTVCYETCNYDGCNSAHSSMRATGFLQWALVAGITTYQIVNFIRSQMGHVGT